MAVRLSIILLSDFKFFVVEILNEPIKIQTIRFDNYKKTLLDSFPVGYQVIQKQFQFLLAFPHLYISL